MILMSTWNILEMMSVVPSDDGNFVDETEPSHVDSEDSEDEELLDGEASDDELSEDDNANVDEHLIGTPKMLLMTQK